MVIGRRPGHSIPELLVALTVLGVAAGAIGAGALLAYRGTADAVRRQVAVAATAGVLDSLLAAPTVGAGAGERQVGAGPGVVRIAWTVQPDGPGAAVSVRARVPGDTADLVRLEGYRIALPPTLPPDSGAAGAGAGVGGLP